MKRKELHILLVEDTETDAQLIIRQIHKIDPTFKVHVVETLPDIEMAIVAFNPQIIISDYNLPSCTGLEILSLVRDKAPETIFVFLTGTLQDEEVAEETVLNGADGFILKKHLNNLHLKLPPYFKKIENKLDIEQGANKQIKENSKFILDIRKYLDDVNAENLTYQERIKKMKDHLDQMKKSIE